MTRKYGHIASINKTGLLTDGLLNGNDLKTNVCRRFWRVKNWKKADVCYGQPPRGIQKEKITTIHFIIGTRDSYPGKSKEAATCPEQKL